MSARAKLIVTFVDLKQIKCQLVFQQNGFIQDQQRNCNSESVATVSKMQVPTHQGKEVFIQKKGKLGGLE